MKNVKRIAGILLALAMICIMVLPSFAAELTGMTGSISIMDNETVKASNKLFAAYKILNLTVYGDETTGEVETFKYAVPREDKNLVDFYEEYFNLNSEDPNFDNQVVAAINKMNDEGRLYEFAEEILKHCTDMVSRTSKKNAAGNGAIFENLALGYYVIEDITVPNETGSHRPVSAVTLDTSLPNVEIEVKAETPVVDKKIDNDNDLNTTDDRVDANEAAIGDTITYVITSEVPEMTGYDKYFFIMKDTMSKGLTYTNNMKVTLAGKELVEGTDYILTRVDNADETTDLKIVFTNFIQYNTPEYVHQPIEVTYTALLNEKCEVNTIPNTNKVHLEYSHNPNVDYEGENEPTEEDLEKEPIGKTPEQKVETYTTTLEIVKTDPNGKRLQGAEFTLTGTTMNTVRIETESFDLDPNGEYWKLKDG
ncbi:MAG: isopeptide-forming domain-containing fimbrial protein, partial [Oscillospiraceae bacterium]|nr:isopeptide-forming domain-containing fimbrial protein [Oscillospiraceae bacterium]